jgi:hypothetical protein
MAKTLTDPRSIEAEIARIREREAGPYSAGMRTSLFNLVIFRSAAGPSAAGAALDHLLGRRPARLITMESALPGSTSVSVSGRCNPDEKNRGVCLEEIGIARGSDELGQDPGIWSSLLIRDLPVLVWWQNRISPLPPILTEEAGLVDKLIVDTSFGETLGEEPMEALRALAAFRGRNPHATVSDLAWRRTMALRVHAAALYEPEWNRARLRALSRVELTGGSRAEALLFFLWLASRLGWRRAEAGASVFTDEAGSQVHTAHTGAFPLSRGFATAFAFRDGGRELGMTCEKKGCISVENQTRPYRLQTEGEILLEEVDGLKQDALFSGVLAAAEEA